MEKCRQKMEQGANSLPANKVGHKNLPYLKTDLIQFLMLKKAVVANLILPYNKSTKSKKEQKLLA